MIDIDFSLLPYEVCSGIVDTFWNSQPLDQLIFYGRIFHGLKYWEMAETIDMSLQSVGVHFKTFVNTVQQKYEHCMALSGTYHIAIDLLDNDPQ